METKKILNAETGTNSSTSYLIEEHSDRGNEVMVFVQLNGGSAVIEASPDNSAGSFVPVDDGALAASAVKPVDCSVGSYVRVSYSGVTTISATIQPKHESNR